MFEAVVPAEQGTKVVQTDICPWFWVIQSCLRQGGRLRRAELHVSASWLFALSHDRCDVREVANDPEFLPEQIEGLALTRVHPRAMEVQYLLFGCQSLRENHGVRVGIG